MAWISSLYYHMQKNYDYLEFFNYNRSDQDISTNDDTLGRERNISRVTRTRSYAPLAISYSLFTESGNCIRAEPKFIFHQPYRYIQAVWKAWFLLYTVLKLRKKERKEAVLLIFAPWKFIVQLLPSTPPLPPTPQKKFTFLPLSSYRARDYPTKNRSIIHPVKSIQVSLK